MIDEQPRDLLKRLRPPTSTLVSTCHVMNDTRPSEFFAALPHRSVYILLSTETKEQKKQGRPGNEASIESGLHLALGHAGS